MNQLKKRYDVILASNELKGEAFLSEIEGKNSLFICTIATTETAKIPGISAAGANPEITDYTPSADAELLLLGKCKSITGVPVTPSGIPTPALITMSALKLANIPVLVVNGGLRIKPQIPFIDLGGFPGKDIRTGNSVKNVEEVIERAKLIGEHLSNTTDCLVIGESVPGGTTTALAVLSAMGIKAKGKISSSMPNNPHSLKSNVVNLGLQSSNSEFGSLKNNPIKAISCVGDPMMPAIAGIAMGAASQIPVLMAGGTQMAAVLAIIKSINPDVLCNIAIGTTRWIIQDNSSDIKSIIRQIYDIPILAADIDFTLSRYPGLKIYETGIVKEGVGAGGSSIAAMTKYSGAISKEILLSEIEKNYKILMTGK